MSYYYGDYPASHTAVCMDFDSFAGSTGAPSATSNFAAGDIQIYKDGGTTQRSSSAGITVSTSFDSQTGLQMIVIDLSDNTDAGFYAAGHEYNVAVADVTIDSQTVRFWVGSFSIERAGGVLALLKAGTAKVTLADGVAHGGTLGSSTATLALSRFNATSQTSNTSAVTATGNGSGNGIAATGGATGAGILGSGGGTSGNGIRALANAGNSSGMTVQGSGANPGLQLDGGATGAGFYIAGGGTSGAGISVNTTSGDAVTITPTAGHGINIAANGTSKHGILSTGGTAGTSDGVKAAAGSGGVDIRGNITGNLVGTVSTLTTYTGNTVQTADVASLITTVGAAGAGLTAVQLTSAYNFAKGTVAVTESYNADGAAPTPVQALMLILQMLTDKSVTSTTLTVNKLDGSTAAATFTLDSSSSPTSITRAT